MAGERKVRLVAASTGLNLNSLFAAYSRNLLFYQKIESRLAESEALHRLQKGESVDELIDPDFMTHPLGRKIKHLKRETQDPFFDPGRWRLAIDTRNRLAHSFFADNARALEDADANRELVAALNRSCADIILPRLKELNDRSPLAVDEDNRLDQASFSRTTFAAPVARGEELDLSTLLTTDRFDVALADIESVLVLSTVCQYQLQRVETYLTILSQVQKHVYKEMPERASTLGSVVRTVESYVGHDDKSSSPGKKIRDVRNNLSHFYLVTAPECYTTELGRAKMMRELSIFLSKVIDAYQTGLPELVDGVRTSLDQKIGAEMQAKLDQDGHWLDIRLNLQLAD